MDKCLNIKSNLERATEFFEDPVMEDGEIQNLMRKLALEKKAIYLIITQKFTDGSAGDKEFSKNDLKK